MIVRNCSFLLSQISRIEEAFSHHQLKNLNGSDQHSNVIDLHTHKKTETNQVTKYRSQGKEPADLLILKYAKHCLFSFCVLLISLNSLTPKSFSLDGRIRRHIQSFRISPPETYQNDRPELYKLGEKLFKDKDLSLPRDISCMTCHHPDHGTSDALPFSIGTGGMGEGPNRIQSQAEITPRNSPALYNKGHSSFATMFWDGRVIYNAVDNTYITPEKELNGQNPPFSHISSQIENVLAMQALFPIVNPSEMRGTKYNELKNSEVWKIIAQRVQSKPDYQILISKLGIKNFNIAHIGNALAYFQKIAFQVNDTPFDQYILGKHNALSFREKRGAIVYFEKGRCARCHNGPLLSNQAFQVIASPQIGQGLNQHKDDQGRYGVFRDFRFEYAFLTQPLRNVALSAPYFHDGAFSTLAQVIDHYDNPAVSLQSYDDRMINDSYRKNYNDAIPTSNTSSLNLQRLRRLHPVLRNPLALSPQEKLDLECFLTKSLTQSKYHSKIDLSSCKN